MCAGLANRFETSSTIVMIVVPLSMLLRGPQIPTRLALRVVMPERR